MNGLWGSQRGPEELLLFGSEDGGLVWSPRRIRIFDGGLLLTHHCRDLDVDSTGRLSARRGTFSAGPATETDGGWALEWTASTESLRFAAGHISCGRDSLGVPTISGQFFDASVVIHVDRVGPDGGVVRIETIEFPAQRRTRCE
jgi:hypothetical protein